MSDTHQQLTDQYRPTSFDEIQGNTTAIDRLKDWAGDFPAERTPRLLEGPAGTGKTSTVEVIADWLNLQLVELNASDARGSDAVERMAGLIRNTTADGERRVVLLDEVDSWHHATDKTPLYDALDNAANVVFLTCNDKWETPSAIVRRCEVESFSLGVRSRRAKIRDISEAEGFDLDDQIIDRLAERPDLRSAINDLQVYGETGEAPADTREWDTSEWDMVDAVLTGTPDLGGDRTRDGVSPGEALLWLDENVKHEYRGLELAWAYEALGRADVAMMQNTEIAQEMIRSVAELRLTEPYHDDNVGRSKSFPEWFRHSQPDPTGGSAEAQLYRALSNYETGEYGLSANFNRFRKVVLPYLQDLPIEERHELILDHRLSPDAYEALDVTKHQHESWVETEAPSKGGGLERTESAADW